MTANVLGLDAGWELKNYCSTHHHNPIEVKGSKLALLPLFYKPLLGGLSFGGIKLEHSTIISISKILGFHKIIE